MFRPPKRSSSADTATPASHHGAWSVLRHPIFRALWVANVASGVGSAMHDMAAVWTMTALTPSATLITLMQTMSSLPLFLLALPAGALADIIDRRRVIIAAQAAALVVTMALVALASLDRLSPLVLLASTAALGVATALTIPTWQALMAEIVEKPDLPGAITLGSVAINISRALGPLIGGILLATSGPAIVFLLNALSFIGIIAVLWRWRRPPAARTGPAEHVLGAMVAAVRFTRHSPIIHGVLIRTAAFAVFAIAPIALLPLIVRQRQLTAADFGAWMGAYGIGGIVAAFVVLPKLRQRFSADGILAGATLLFATATAALTVIANRWAAGAVLFLAGGSWLVSLSTLAVAGQNAYPNWIRARSSAIALIVQQGALALGAVVWGQVATYTGAETALQIAAGGLFASLVLGRVATIGRAQQLDLTPSDHWDRHRIDTEPADDDGPILVTLEYEVTADNAPAFRRAMNRLREVRLRDGAFRWTLLRSLEKPGVFRESFYVGTWGEHIRQHARATAEDRRIEEAALAWHAGKEPPRAGHFIVEKLPADARSAVAAKAVS